MLVTETAEEFEAAAPPDVDPSLENHCVEGRLEWLENGEPITTVLIPVTPVAADASSQPQGNQGVTLDGVVIAASAPVDLILEAPTRSRRSTTVVGTTAPSRATTCNAGLLGTR